MIDLSTTPLLYNCSEGVYEKHFWIKDNENGVCELCSIGEGQLSVINKQRKDVDFLKIDGCVYQSLDGERCDCSLLTNEKIYFIEFKEKNDFSNKKSKKRSMNKAKSQIANTINNFKTFNIDILNTYGLIVLTPKLPHAYRQIVTTCQQTDIADLFVKTGCPNLLIGNIVEI